jgi:hypothetical protein
MPFLIGLFGLKRQKKATWKILAIVHAAYFQSVTLNQCVIE